MGWMEGSTFSSKVHVLALSHHKENFAQCRSQRRENTLTVQVLTSCRLGKIWHCFWPMPKIKHFWSDVVGHEIPTILHLAPLVRHFLLSDLLHPALIRCSIVPSNTQGIVFMVRMLNQTDQIPLIGGRNLHTIAHNHDTPTVRMSHSHKTYPCKADQTTCQPTCQWTTQPPNQPSNQPTNHSVQHFPY